MWIAPDVNFFLKISSLCHIFLSSVQIWQILLINFSNLCLLAFITLIILKMTKLPRVLLVGFSFTLSFPVSFVLIWTPSSSFFVHDFYVLRHYPSVTLYHFDLDHLLLSFPFTLFVFYIDFHRFSLYDFDSEKLR